MIGVIMNGLLCSQFSFLKRPFYIFKGEILHLEGKQARVQIIVGSLLPQKL